MLAAVQLTGVSDLEFNSSMHELRELATTLGFQLVGMFMQHRDHFDTYRGIGKRQEMCRFMEIKTTACKHRMGIASSSNNQSRFSFGARGPVILDRDLHVNRAVIASQNIRVYGSAFHRASQR